MFVRTLTTAAPCRLLDLLLTHPFLYKECFGACKTGTNSGNAAGLGLSLGVCAAFACNSAHELAHGRKRQDRAVGALMFLTTGYGHFWAAHATHHAKVILCSLSTHACASWTAAPHAVQVLWTLQLS